MHNDFVTPPGYIPYYYDTFVQWGIVVFWIVVGVVSVIQGRRRLLPSSLLQRRIVIVGLCALASIFLYNGYILQRQTVESSTSVHNQENPSRG